MYFQLKSKLFQTPNFSISYFILKCYKSHYDTLNLEQNCTIKEIKNSYIELSKKHHPDKTSCKLSHKEFVKITEAYNTLSKPDLRRNYDFQLKYPPSRNYSVNDFSDPVYYHQRGSSSAYNARTWKKRSHGIIVFFCVLLTLMGACIQFILIRESFVFKREKLKENSDYNELVLKHLRKTAEENGNELQIQLLRAKFAAQEEQRRSSEI